MVTHCLIDAGAGADEGLHSVQVSMPGCIMQLTRSICSKTALGLLLTHLHNHTYRITLLLLLIIIIILLLLLTFPTSSSSCLKV